MGRRIFSQVLFWQVVQMFKVMDDITKVIFSQEEIMGEEDHKAKAIISTVGNCFHGTGKSNWSLFSFQKCNDTVPFAQEDTFEEEPQEQKDSCQDWQQLQQLGLWDVVCGSGINISTKLLNLGHWIHYNPKRRGGKKVKKCFTWGGWHCQQNLFFKEEARVGVQEEKVTPFTFF